MKRQTASTNCFGGVAGLETDTLPDALGRVYLTQRIGTNGGSPVVQSQTQYDLLNRVARQTNALGGVTIITYGISSNGGLCVTNIYPDNGTRIEKYYRDGRLASLSAKPRAPGAIRLLCEQDTVDYGSGYGRGNEWREVKLEIKLNGNGTNEWTKTYFDGLGRAYKTVYAAASAPYPTAQSFYNALGQIWKQVDPDGVTTLFLYNVLCVKEYTILATTDTALNITQDQLASLLVNSEDRITQVEKTYLSSPTQ